MHAQSSASIRLQDQPHVFTVEDKQTLITVVDQLNIVTEKLRLLEEQIANGTLIVNQQPTGHLHLANNTDRPKQPSTGWQPTKY